MKRCDKYRGLITDAALGSLAPGRDPELLAHAATCDACREAYSQAREVNAFSAAIDRGVESLVSGEPSPHFNSRLRARIAEEASAPRFSWRTWAPIAATAMALAIVLVVFVLRLDEKVPAAPANPAVAVNSSVPPISTNLQRAAEPSDRSSLSAHPAPFAHRRPHLLHTTPSEPEVLVDPGELAAAIQFANAIRSGRVDGKKLVAAQQQVNAPIEIKPIEIAPLSTLDVDLVDARPNSSRP